MKIDITRSGGFGGLTRTWSLEVSRTEVEQRWLPLAEAEAGAPAAERELRSDLEATGSDAGRPDSALQRDRFTYRIAIGYTEVHLPESRLGDPWRELIERAKGAGTADARSEDTDPGKPQELL